MYKRIPFFLIFTLFFLTIPSMVSAADITVGTWSTSGSQLWRTVYPLHTATVIDGASELYYPHAGTYLTASYENKLDPNHSLFIEGGLLTAPTTKTGSDSDWDTSQNSGLWYYGQFKTTDKGHFITADWRHHTTPTTTIFAGYTYNINHYSMTDGVYSISNYASVNQALPTLDSHYTMIYQGPHLGISHEFPLTPKLTVIGSFSYAPLLLAQGHGWWNLRDLSFDHAGTAQMLDTSIGIRYANTPQNIAITMGYRYQSFQLASGKENLSSTVSWDKATNVQQGYFLTGEKKF